MAVTTDSTALSAQMSSEDMDAGIDVVAGQEAGSYIARIHGQIVDDEGNDAQSAILEANDSGYKLDMSDPVSEEAFKVVSDGESNIVFEF